MKITLAVRHFDASQKLKDFASKELKRINKYFEGKINGNIILEENGNNKTVEMRISAFGKFFVSNNDGNDFYKIIPKTVDKIESQLKSAKSKAFGR